jgi:class 3 adenylate cyclase
LGLRSRAREVKTILFTDIVGSPQLATRLGDRRWRSILDRHDETARRLISEIGGRLVKQAGDGLLALFKAPGDGVRYARRSVTS